MCGFYKACLMHSRDLGVYAKAYNTSDLSICEVKPPLKFRKIDNTSTQALEIAGLSVTLPCMLIVNGIIQGEALNLERVCRKTLHFHALWYRQCF